MLNLWLSWLLFYMIFNCDHISFSLYYEAIISLFLFGCQIKTITKFVNLNGLNFVEKFIFQAKLGLHASAL